jgi:hypothetical protein
MEFGVGVGASVWYDDGYEKITNCICDHSST